MYKYPSKYDNIANSVSETSTKIFPDVFSLDYFQIFCCVTEIRT